jgi:hypothetical protein
MFNMTSIFIDGFAHDQETLIITWHMSWLARGNQGHVFLYVTRVLMFLLNIVISWHIILWTNEIWQQKYTLLFAFRAYLLQLVGIGRGRKEEDFQKYIHFLNILFQIWFFKIQTIFKFENLKIWIFSNSNIFKIFIFLKEKERKSKKKRKKKKC